MYISENGMENCFFFKLKSVQNLIDGKKNRTLVKKYALDIIQLRIQILLWRCIKKYLKNHARFLFTTKHNLFSKSTSVIIHMVIISCLNNCALTKYLFEASVAVGFIILFLECTLIQLF